MLKIAWRNLLRNKRRSGLSMTLIVIGASVLFLFQGYRQFCLDGLASMSEARYLEYIGTFQTMFFFIASLIFILVFFSVLEIMSMAFYERLHEIGTIRAIGTLQVQVFALLGQEGLLLGATGGLLGLALGWGAGAVLNAAHATYTPAGFSAPVPLAVTMTAGDAAIPFLLVLGAVGLSILLPAFKASRLRVAEALRR